MQACDNVIVTIRMAGMDMDMELPAFLPLEELEKKLLETLRVLKPAAFIPVELLKFGFQNGRLKDTDTLASAGVWDGSILEIFPGKEERKTL